MIALLAPVKGQVAQTDTLLRQQVEMEPQADMPLDDYLIQLAKTADVNFIADATEFASDAKVQPYPAGAAAIAGMASPQKDGWQPNLINRIADVAALHHLSHLRQGERTFLFWSEPDVRELGRLIAQERAALPALTPADYDTIQVHLSDYLQRAHNWKPGETQPDLQIRFADLPPELRVELLQVVDAELSHSIENRNLSTKARSRDGEPQRAVSEDISFKTPETVWFSDEFWKNAHIKGYSQTEKVAGSNPPRTHNVSYLVIGGAIGEQDARTTFAPIGRLDNLPQGR